MRKPDSRYMSFIQMDPIHEHEEQEELTLGLHLSVENDTFEDVCVVPSPVVRKASTLVFKNNTDRKRYSSCPPLLELFPVQ